MEWMTAKQNALNFLKKYRYIGAAVLVGILLLIQPGDTEPLPETQPEILETQPGLETSLGNLLSQVSGAGRVEVLLTQLRGEETLYQTDQDLTDSDTRQDTVLITDRDRNETGLVRQINPPIYQGALVVCQGADSPSVRLAIVEAVMSVTGLTSDRITVLKMK